MSAFGEIEERLDKEIRDLKLERDQLREELDRERGDTKLWDWLEGHKDEVSWRKKSWAVIGRTPRLENVWPDDKCTGIKTYKTAREAMRAAMAEEPTGGKPE